MEINELSWNFEYYRLKVYPFKNIYKLFITVFVILRSFYPCNITSVLIFFNGWYFTFFIKIEMGFKAYNLSVLVNIILIFMSYPLLFIDMFSNHFIYFIKFIWMSSDFVSDQFDANWVSPVMLLTIDYLKFEIFVKA